ncbi:MAG: hypothetical protein SFV19_02455 [Rhodospirillaceae bacterium]|nr:hypothetical protein [Rhodospirillaceae bacterium]
MTAKQTGPDPRVKVARHVAARLARSASCLIIAALGLTTCADVGWHHTERTAADQRADRKQCERQAERTTLEASGTTRGAYGLQSTAPMTPGQDARGASPLARHDQAELEGDYDRAFARCMRGKGYRQGHAADQPKA